MNLRIRIISIILIICALAGIAVYARSERSVFEDYSLFPANKTTVRLWYTDDSLTPYLQSRAVSFSESHNKIRLEPVLVSGLEYLEAINSASVNEEGFPDLFITTNDSLEKAYLAGLAMEIENGGTYLDPKVFPQAAVNSVTYKDKLIAYPFYFETSSLIYNKTYLENMAVETMQSQIDAAEGQEAQENADAAVAQGSEPDEDDESDAASSEESTEITQGMIDEAVAESLPLNISDILKFAETYTAPEEVEAVFKWDVTDIFYNFFFVGNYMNTGGKAGDDISQLDIYNTDTISCMKIYQQLNQIFAIDADSINYDSMVSDFIAGKTVFTVATTDIIKKIEDAKASGECKFEFAVADMPGLTDNFGTRTMSVTECIVVNGYTEHIAEANAAARYLCNDASGDIYNMAGKVAAHYGVNYDNPNLDTFVDVYADSVPMPKTIETSNLWMELEIAFTKIWNGADCNDTLRQVSENIMTQVTGSPYTVEKIPDPQDVDLTADLVEESD